MATRTLGPGKLTITDTGKGRDFSAEVTTDWTLEGTIVDNFDTDNLANWCFDHSGQTLPFEWVPNNKGATKWNGKVNISPVSIGGDVKSKNSNDFSFPATELAHSAYTSSSEV